MLANNSNGGGRKSNQVANLHLDLSQTEAANLLSVSPRSVANAKQVQQTARAG